MAQYRIEDPLPHLRHVDLVVEDRAAIDVHVAFYNEPMVPVVRPGHPLAAKARPAWADLAALPAVMPPPWASLRVKLEQQFFKHGLQPPTDVVETASFLALLTFVTGRGAVGFLARSVARHFEGQGLFHVLALPVRVELPPVGMMTMRGRAVTATTAQLMECLRTAGAGVARA